MGQLLDQLILAVPSVVYAIIILGIAFVVAEFAKRLVIKLIDRLNLDTYTDKLGVYDEDTGSSSEFVGKLVYIIVFLLFIPGVLTKLGLQSISAPIEELISRFIAFLPNLVAATVILAVGLFIAKIIRQLLTPVLKKLNLDKLQEKAGFSSEDGVSISSMISYLVYVVIIIAVLTAALQVLNISAISVPAIEVLNNIFNALPKIFIAIAIIIIGNYIAKIAGRLLENILSSVGTDEILKKVITSEKEDVKKVSLSKIIGETIRYIILTLFAVEAFNFLEFEILQTVGVGIIAYLPYLISAALILGVAILLGTWVEGLLNKKCKGAKLCAPFAKISIIVIAVFMALSQLGLASSIVNAAFIIVVGALAVAFAVAFGIGGRDFAANTLKRLEEEIEVKDE
ncbi:MAG: mechanosensitive ion channel [Clostridiales bacterium]|nr:mechanosensitive ion channel [Clostridiales bacterium]